MQASPSGGMLAVRLASHALAACSLAAPMWPGLASLSSRRQVSSSASSAAGESTSSPVPSLSVDQRQQLPKLLSLLERPGSTAARLGALTSLAVSYRDLSVSLSALHMRHLGLDPLTASEAEVAAVLAVAAWERERKAAAAAEAAAAAAEAAADGSEAPPAAPAAAKPQRGTYLPLKDVSELPDDVQVDGVTPAPAQPQYPPELMDKVSCWAALQPGHLEVSQQLMTGIHLFPPTEAAHPTYVDFDAALRLLAKHRSGRRMRLQRKLMRRQDKYQLKTWEHHSGEA